MIASSLELDNFDVYDVVSKYTEALALLDDYDHQNLIKPDGINNLYKLDCNDCRRVIDSMQKNFNTNLFYRRHAQQA